MVAQLVKGLKPAKLKVKQVRLNILNELRKEGQVIKSEFDKTTASWDGAKPTFEIAIGLTRQDAIVLVGPGGNPEGAQKWVWLDEGTKKNYPITAKNPRVIKRNGKSVKMPPMLIFRHGSGFTPKTQIGIFASGSGANTGSWVSKKTVTHPGIEARQWTQEIAKRRRKKFTQNIIKAARV